MANKPVLLKSNKPAYIHSPVPRPLKARFTYLCTTYGLSNAQALFQAINLLSAECGMEPLDWAIMDGFVAYPDQNGPAIASATNAAPPVGDRAAGQPTT